MLYDRPYMKAPGTPNMRSPVLILILINVGVFILGAIAQIAFGAPNERAVFSKLFGLEADNLFHGMLWTPLTYGFVHGNLMHLFLNMLGLFFLGPAVERILGQKRFLQLYFACILSGAFLFLVFHVGEPVDMFGRGVMVVGASAAVIGVVSYFCLCNPNQPMTLLLFFVLPVTVKPKWLLVGLLAIDLAGLLFVEIPLRFGLTPAYSGGIAHSAHLGGMAMAFILYKGWMSSRSYAGSKGVDIQMPEWMKNRHKKRGNYSVTITKKPEETASASEIDRILDKISEQGFASLTPQERKTLEKKKRK